MTGRTAQVKIKNFKSQPFYIQSGVPQGSHLTSLLFILCINDLTDVIKYSKLLLFADDATIFKRVRSSEDSLELQRDISAIANWCESNALDMNVGKCFIIKFDNDTRSFD